MSGPEAINFEQPSASESAKAFVEVVRFGTSGTLALTAVTGVLYQLTSSTVTTQIFNIQADNFWFSLALLVTISQIVAGYAVVSASFENMFEANSISDVIRRSNDLRRVRYSIFSILTLICAVLWVVAIGAKALIFS